MPGFLALNTPRSEGEELLRRTLTRAAAPKRYKREQSLSENHRKGRGHWPSYVAR